MSDSERIDASHSRMMDLRSECARAFGGIRELPIIASRPTVLRELYAGGAVLDIGSGRDCPLRAELRLAEGACYHTLDADPGGAFTYRLWDDVPPDQRYEFISASQVLEHLTFEEAHAMLIGVRKHLAADGRFVCTVPNMMHPTRYWNDPTHVTTWTYMDVYADCATAGLAVTSIARYGRQHLKGFINRFLARRVGMLFSMDWCDSILVVAKPGLEEFA